MRPDEMISRARAGLILEAPFFATLALGLKVEEMTDRPTMATDGERLLYNPEFVQSISGPELRGVIAHEVMHCAMLHHTRRSGRDPKLWNVACDHAVNLELLKAGFDLPAGRLADPRFDGMSAETIFAALKSEKPGDGQPGDAGTDPGGCGEILDAAPGHDAAALSAAEAEAKTKVIQAAAVAKAAGKLPGFAAAMVEAIRKPEIDWRAVLRRFVDESARRDYSWSRLNRRHLHAGLYLPGSVPDGMALLGVIIDVSVSLPMEALQRFLGELQGAIDDAAPDRVMVIQCNTAITQRDEYGAGERINPEVNAGGGTDMRPAFDAIPTGVSAIICFTDLEFRRDRIPIDPGSPTLWVKWDDGGIPAPFGETIRI